MNTNGTRPNNLFRLLHGLSASKDVPVFSITSATIRSFDMRSNCIGISIQTFRPAIHCDDFMTGRCPKRNDLADKAEWETPLHLLINEDKK